VRALITPPLPVGRIVAVDDDPDIRDVVRVTLGEAGYEVTLCPDAERALETFDDRDVSLVLTDLRLPGKSGLELLTALKQRKATAPVIIMTSHASVDGAVAAIREGAADYITKPFAPDLLAHRVGQVLESWHLEHENRHLRRELSAGWRSGRIIAVSPAMQRVVRQVEMLARRDARVLLEGESGTGKELLARLLHTGGHRASGPFVAVNCPALPASLAESELFGHVKGAFTGATADRPGKIEAADGGVLFLDEVSELPLELQPKLLRALQEEAVERVGETRQRPVNIRVVCASNRNLLEMVRAGRFREDLYFRLAVVTVHVPPLRERPEDIAPLVRHFVRGFADLDGVPMAADEIVSPDALAALGRRTFRGNVRELANLVEAAFALHDGNGPLRPEDFDGESRPVNPALPEPAAVVQLPPEGAPLDALVRDILVQALEQRSWNQSAAARMLRIPRHVLQYRMAKYGIVPPVRA
jgi:DNA-binding NtrC family response regulator